MNRLRVRVFSFILALLVGASALPVRADETPAGAFWFSGTRLIFARSVPLAGDVAVPVHDPGMARLLARLGATIAYAPDQRYIVLTSADRRTIAFTLGSTQYTAGGVTARAAFAPFLDGGDAIVPLYAIAHALYVEPVADGDETVLQPQIGALDIRSDGRQTTVVVRAATPVAYVRRSDTPTHLELDFSGVSSTLSASRRAGSLATVSIVPGGSPKNPTTVVSIDWTRPTAHDVQTPSPYEVGFAFPDSGPATPLNAPAAAVVANAPPPPPVPAALDATPFASAAPTTPPDAAPLPAAALAAPAIVTGVAVVPDGDGLNVHVSVTGAATYDWHRLLDLRWYLDVHNATLTDAGRDEHPLVAAVDSVRIRQIGTPDAPTVRIAMTLRGEKHVDVTPLPDGFAIAVSNVDDLAAVRTGSGSTAAAPTAAATDAAGMTAMPTPAPIVTSTPWKFGITNGTRIIVLDPGHGGDDMGTAHNGLVEKTITIDIARRLRALLVAQGWTVRMTRDSDIDPVSASNLTAMRADGKPNPDDRAYLQTRCDVANSVNARLFISIHVNYSDSPAVNGTTFYWYKPEDEALATTLERAVIPAAGTTDIGPRHENFYVIRHTTMPAVLIETAFISNPHDAALLGSPAFLQNMAAGIASGVRAFAGSPSVSQADQ